MSAPKVIGLGELLWDVFPDSRRPGGAPANVAFQAAQLGCAGRIASRIGDDDEGREIRQFLEERGLHTDLLQVDPDHPTGYVTVAMSEGGQPSYTIHEDVAWDYLQPTPELLEAVGQADAICFGTLAQRSRESRETIHHCLTSARPETLIVFDVNLRQSWYDRESIERSLHAAKAIKLNDEELETLGEMFELSTAEPESFANELRSRYGLTWMVLTRGGEGCLVSGPDGTTDVPGEPIEVVDTVGAGDAFTAAFITGTLRGWPVANTARFANRVGGLVASRSGAMPDIAAEAARLMKEFEPGR